MKKKISSLVIIFLVFLLLPQNTAYAASKTKENIIFRLVQQIEIIKQEISLLASLVSSWNSTGKISSPAYLVVDFSNDSILLQKNINQSYPTASIAKLMTAVISVENINPEGEITLNKKMLLPLGYSPCLFQGLRIKSQDLLKAALIQSVNDAAEALSYFIGKEKFIKMMNKKAKELEMTNTVFYDVHGLNPCSRSSASDLIKLIKYIYKKHPEILEITKENDFWLPDSEKRLLKFRNLNNFYPLSNFIGGKTGYLIEAKQTFLGIFKIKNKPVAIALLYSNNTKADVFKILKKIKNK